MSAFLKNVGKLVSGTVLAQIIGLLLTPILTRLYLPDDFGVYQLFLSLNGIIVIFAALSYERAILLPEDEKDSAGIAVLCILLIGTISLISGGIVFLFSHEIGDALNTPQISPVLIYLPAAIFVTSLISVGNLWLSRRKRFGRIAAAQVVNSVTSKVAQIGGGFLSAASFGLIVGWIIGSSASLVVLLSQVRDDVLLFRTVTRATIKNIAIRYKNFPLYASWSALANSISTSLAPFFLAYFFTPTIVGYYSIANMVVLLPMNLVGNATSQVFYQRACEERNRKGNIAGIVREIQQRLISIGMLPMFILLIIGPELFSFVLGSQWAVAGEYAGILAPWLLFVFIASPLGSIFNVLERQAVGLTFNLLILISRFVILIIGGLSGDPIVALALFSGTGIFFWGGMNLYLLKISGVPYRLGIKDYLKYFLLALIVSVPLLITKFLSVSTIILFIVAGIVSLIYYFIVLYYDPVLKNTVLAAVRRFSYGR